MNRNYTLFFVLVAGIIAIAISGNSTAAKLEVDDDYSTPDNITHFKSIDDAINAANNGDTIFIHNGTYNEYITVDKEIKIMGESKDAIINGTGWGYLIRINVNNVSIENLTVKNGYRGIYFYDVDNISIENVEITDCHYGIFLSSSNNDSIIGNTIHNISYRGIYISGNNNSIKQNRIYYGGTAIEIYGNNNCIENNNIRDNINGMRMHGNHNKISSNNILNNEYGIWIEYSFNNTLRNNIIENNTYNFYIEGWSIQSFIHDIDTSNKINGKPIQYLVNKSNITINGNAGFVALVSCNNITVRNAILSNNGDGMLIVNTTNATIYGNTIHDNEDNGIYIAYSRNVSIGSNEIYNNDYGVYARDGELINTSFNNVYNCSTAIYFDYYDDSTIHANTISNNSNGIEIDGGNHNKISSNNILNNEYGIWMEYSFNNTLRNNIIENNTYNFYIEGWSIQSFIHDIDTSNKINGKPIQYLVNKSNITINGNAGFVALVSCNNITVRNAILSNNGDGMLIVNTTNATIYGNTIHDNEDNGIYIAYSRNVSIGSNEIYNCSDGIYVESNSYDVKIHSNTIFNNSNGIEIESNFNAIANNSIYNNYCGIHIEESNNNASSNYIYNCEYGIKVYGYHNKAFNNSIYNCSDGGIYVHGNYNNISFNKINYCGKGIYIYYGYNNISYNTIYNCSYGIYTDWSYHNSIFSNEIYNSSNGIYLEGSYNNISSNNIWNCYRAIYLYSDYNNISYNMIYNSSYGIYSYWASYNNIFSNEIYNCSYNGIYLYDSSYSIITSNSLYNNSHGIELRYSDRNSISKNRIYNNSYGIYIYSSDDNQFSCNVISGNYGIYSSYSDGNTFSLNDISNSTYGLYLYYYCSENNILFNRLHENAFALYLNRSDNNLIYANEIKSNDHGLYLYQANSNTIFLNIFSNIYNANISSSSNIWNSSYEIDYIYNGNYHKSKLGNYWHDYNGSDANNDGIGDVAYTIDGENDGFPLMNEYRNYSIQFVYNDRTGKKYATIQEAIDDGNTMAGDTLYVYPGIYVENVVINKEIKIIGKGNAIVKASLGGNAFEIKANNVTIEGLAIESEDNTIEIEGNGCNIQNNSIESDDYGVYLNHASNCSIFNNSIAAYYGLYSYYSSNTTISNNFINDSYRGIYLYNTNNCTISHNSISNGSYGIYISNSYHAIVRNNTISNMNNEGIKISYSKHCSILSNKMMNVRGFLVEGYELQHFQHFVCPLNTINGKPIYYITSNGIVIDDSMAPPCCVYVVGANGVVIHDISVGRIKLIYSNVTIYNVNLQGNNDDDFYIMNSNVGIYNSSFVNCEVDSQDYNNITLRNVVFDGSSLDIRGYLNINRSIFTDCYISLGINNSNINDSYFEDSRIYYLYGGANNSRFVRNVMKDGTFNARSFSYVYLNSFIGTYIPCYYYQHVIWNTPYMINSTYMGNYWSDYNGNDSNNDGIGDTPYTICNYYGTLYNDSYPLMHSYVTINAPDIVIEEIKINPYPFSSGQHVEINATIKNIGNENITKPFYVTFYRDSHYIGFAYIDGLAINDSKIASITWYAQGGDYDIIAYADAYDNIAEFKESNNKASIHVSTPLPDLIVRNITFPLAEAGDRIFINVSIANIGIGNASTFYVVIKVDGSIVAWHSASLSSNNNTWINFTNVWKARYGMHNIVAIIDYFDSIEESNESNNAMAKEIMVNDTTPPYIYWIYPYNNSISKHIQQIKLWTSDGYGSGVNLSLCSFNITNGTISNISMKWNIIILNVSLAEGKHVLNAIIKDNSGNEVAYTYNFITDSTPPSITIYGIEDGVIYTSPVKPYYTAEDSNLLYSYARLNGHVFINNHTISNDGSYSLLVYARDKAGNEARKIVNFSIDSPPSPPPWVSISWNNRTARLKWAASPSPDIAGYNVYRNGSKINDMLLLNTYFNDTNGKKDATYSVRAVDFLGHESMDAMVKPISIEVKDATFINYFPNLVSVDIENNGNEIVNISNIKINVISYDGSIVYNSNIADLSINASDRITRNLTLWIENAEWIEINASIEGDGYILYKKHISCLDIQPLKIETQQLMEGYADRLNIKFRNYGNVPITINQHDFVATMYIDGIEYKQFYGKSRSITIEPAENGSFVIIVYTPTLAKNVSIVLNATLKYGSHSHIFSVERHMNVKRQASQPVEIFVRNITKGMDAIIDAKFYNMGSSILNAKARILIKNGNVTIASSDYPFTARVNAHSTYDFIFNVVIPLNASDIIKIEAIINASYDDNFIITGSKFVSTIPPPYNANASVDKSLYNIGENITIRGRAFYKNGSVASNVTLKVTIINRGFIRNFYTTTNSTGWYKYIFHPVEGEAGRYIVSVVHPMVRAWEADASFEILGLYVPKHFRIDITQNQSMNISFDIYNTGESNLTGITIDVVSSFNGITASILNYPAAIPPGGKSKAIINIKASPAAENATLVINISSNEGAKARCVASIVVHVSKPLLKANPYYIYEGMKPGETIFRTIEIRNNGYGDAHNVTIQNSSIPWIYIAGNSSMGNIARGNAKYITIGMAPPSNASGIFDGYINISCINCDVLSIPVRIIVTPNETGSVAFIVRDEVGKVVHGIEVTLVNKAIPTLTFTNKTDENGSVVFKDLPVGIYEYRIISPLYHTYVNTTTIEAGITKQINVTVISSFLHIEWEVLPIKIMDSYVIVHNITYETKVPVPYISVSPSFENIIVNASYAMEHGYAVYHGQLVLKNENEFLSVFNVTPDISFFGSDASNLISIDFGVNVIPEIPPNGSVVVPYTIRIAGHHSPTIDPCKTYTITIHYTAGQVCVNGTWVDIPAGTDTITIKPVCFSLFADVVNFMKDAGLMISGIEEIKDAISLPSDVYTVVQMAVTCYTNHMNSCQGATGNCIWDIAKYASTKLPVAGDISTIVQDLWSIGQDGYNCLFSNSCISQQNCNPTTPPPPNAVLIGGGGGGLGSLPWGGGGAGEIVTTGDCYGSPMMTCIRVKFQIKQKLTMERQGFDAMLRLTNTRPDYALENLSINVIIRDNEGNPANDKFFLRLADMNGIDSIENGSLDVNTTATIHWLIIPKPGAGGVMGEHYTVMAFINYSLHGIEFTAKTWPDDIEVEPMPILHLDYMLPTSVEGDDPATPQKEPIIPFIFGVRIKNIGHGVASNLTIQSAQPTIVSQTPGAHVFLRIIGTLLNGNTIPNSLTINFGNIPPGNASTAAWIMECNLKGEFVEYNATFEHDAALGGRETSLIKNITTHWLFKDIIDYLANDTMIDFLVDDDRNGVPEKIIDSNGMDIPVRKVNSTIQWIDGNTARIMLNHTIGAEWFYAEVPFNHEGNVIVKRSDGLVIDSHNAWVENNKLHIVDCGPASIYLVTFYSAVANAPPVANFTWAPSNPDDLTTVIFNASMSYDSDGNIVNYTWQFGDGDVAYGMIVSHRYKDDGNYNVTLIVRDDDGNVARITKIIMIANVPPVANFTWAPSNPDNQTIVSFNASSSYDNDGSIVNYTWDFGDGSVAYGSIVNHKYARNGKYNVTLTVTDDDGSVSTIQKTICIGIKPWDINMDGRTNIQDLIIVAMHFNAHEGDTNYEASADLNSDGVINILDLIIVAMHWTG